ncbi:unnamed protein product, partial [Polarella glacialis]
ARQMIVSRIKEMSGLQAPADGVVIIVPGQADNQSLPLNQRMAHGFANLTWQTGCGLRAVGRDRIVVQGGRTAQAVVQLQAWMEWRGLVQLPDGQQLDAWKYGHLCEVTGTGSALLPNMEPDKAASHGLFCFALGLSADNQQATPLVQLATQALLAPGGLRIVTTAIVRAASSVSVHAEFASMKTKACAQLLCAFHGVLPIFSTSIHQRFITLPLFKTLCALGSALADPREGILLRSRGFIAVKEAVPEDGAWHNWDEITGPDGPLALFWKELRSWINERKSRLGVSSPSAEWLSVPAVMMIILKPCIAPP